MTGLVRSSLNSLLFSRLGLAVAFAAGSVGFTANAIAQTSPFKNLDQVAQSLNIAAFRSQATSKTVKIAILDNGFRGYQAEVGRTLPSATVYVAGPIPVDPASEESHGLFMAQIVSGLLAKTPNVRYELHLMSAFGYSNLERAVQNVIDGRFDIALYAQVWEYGGFGDGRGFINKLVSRATQAGVLWINAAGNFADATYKTAIDRTADDWASLPGPNRSVQIRCLENTRQKCSLRIVLSWNDFKDDVQLGSDKDLDLVLTDDTLRIIKTAGLKQTLTIPQGEAGYSLYPREIIQADVEPGLYFIRVKIRSQNFSKSKDELRIVTSGDYLQQIDTNSANESLLPPADNNDVVAIGASDSQKSSRSLAFRKPELITTSLFTLNNDESYKGSSNSAAITAAVATLMKAIKPTLNSREFLRLVAGPAPTGGSPGGSGNPEGSPGAGLPLGLLQFAPTGGGCFITAVLPQISPSMFPVLRAGAVSVASTMGFKLFTSYDPFSLTPGFLRRNWDDILVIGPFGFQVLPRGNQPFLPVGIYEVVQQPQGQFVCGFRQPGDLASPSGAVLRLPNPGRF